MELPSLPGPSQGVSRPIKPLPPFASFPLLCKETLVPSSTSTTRPIPAVVRFTFGYLSDTPLPVDARTQHVKVVRPGAHKPRSYTPTPSPAGSFALVVKIYPRGGSSQWLDSIPLGTRVPVIGPLPLPIKRRVYSPGNRVVILALGIGITLGFAAAREELRQGGASVVLVQAVRYPEELLFVQEIAEVADRYGDRFCITRVASAEKVEGWKQGRVDEQMVKESVGDCAKEDVRFLVVGTKPMMKQLWAMLTNMGYGQKQHALLRKPYK